MTRVGDRRIEFLVLLAAALLLLFLLQQWSFLAAPSRAQGSVGSGWAISEILGPDLRLKALGNQELVLHGESAGLVMSEIGPLQVNLLPKALQLSDVQARLPGMALRIRADLCRVSGKALLFTGAVRMDTREGKGLLFTDRLKLSLGEDRLRTGELAILSPKGLIGGKGGRVVPGFESSLAELVHRSR